MKFAVIGAGLAGICAVKHIVTTQRNQDVTVFEKSNTIGGTWVYTDSVDTDEYGMAIHSSMYQGLKYISFIKFYANVFLIFNYNSSLFILEQIYQKKLWPFLISQCLRHTKNT